MVAEKKPVKKPTAEKKPKAQQPKAKAEVHAKPRVKAETSVSTATPDNRNALQKRREMVGIVVSDKMEKTIVVKIDRRVRHRLYKKYIERSRRFKAHDEKNEAKPGDLVSLVESRPMSREKRWVLQSIIRKAGQAPEVTV